MCVFGYISCRIESVSINSNSKRSWKRGMDITIYPTVTDSFTTAPSDYRKYRLCFRLLNWNKQISADKWSQGKLFVLCLNNNAYTFFKVSPSFRLKKKNGKCVPKVNEKNISTSLREFRLATKGVLLNISHDLWCASFYFFQPNFNASLLTVLARQKGCVSSKTKTLIAFVGLMRAFLAGFKCTNADFIMCEQ